jgi:hypothetical protein
MVNIPIPTGPTIESAINGLSTVGKNPSGAGILRFPPILGTSITSVLTGAASSGITDAISAAVAGGNSSSILGAGATGAGVAAAGVIMNQQQTYPYVQFQIIKYQPPWGLVDNKSKSATVGTTSDTVPTGGMSTNAFSFSSGYSPMSTVNQQTAASVNGGGAKPGTTTVATICLPLPTDLQDTLSPSWNVSGLAMTETFQQAYTDWRNGKGDLTKVGKDILNSIGLDKLRQAIPKNSLGFQQGTITNPRKQALFAGIDPRTFTFNYLLSPQNQQEAQMIEKIVNAFRNNALPTIASGQNGLIFDFPCEFKITFNQTAMFPVINSCVCTSVVTNFSSAAMQLLADGHPVQIGLTLTFTETDVRTNGDAGFQTQSTGSAPAGLANTIANSIKKLL